MLDAVGVLDGSAIREIGRRGPSHRNQAPVFVVGVFPRASSLIADCLQQPILHEQDYPPLHAVGDFNVVLGVGKPDCVTAAICNARNSPALFGSLKSSEQAIALGDAQLLVFLSENAIKSTG